MKIIGIIPARFASTRFPGKPLAIIDGKTMIQRVYEQCRKAVCLSDVIVATDDQRILDHVVNFGGKGILTGNYHRSGTERCAEAVILSCREDFPDIVINIQGDEPFIHPRQLDELLPCFTDTNVGIATLCQRITDHEELINPNVVKVITDLTGKALYFSRSVIPYTRGKEDKERIDVSSYFKHVGIYAYKTAVLLKIVKLPPSPLETAESLEQLRWLENGYTIGVGTTQYESQAVDTPEDLMKVMNINK